MAAKATYNGLRFEIEADSTVGFYLYVFDGDKCTHDYLQDTLDFAKQYALDQFGVPLNAWHASEK
jgi:hypothetical protein